MTVQDAVQDRAFHFTFPPLLRTVIPRILVVGFPFILFTGTHNQTAAKLRRFVHYDDTWEKCLAYSCIKKLGTSEQLWCNVTRDFFCHGATAFREPGGLPII